MNNVLHQLSVRRIAAQITESIEQAITEWEAMSPEERLQRQQADFIKVMAERGIKGYFVGNTDEFVITEMPRPVTHITLEIAQTIHPNFSDKEADQ